MKEIAKFRIGSYRVLWFLSGDGIGHVSINHANTKFISEVEDLNSAVAREDVDLEHASDGAAYDAKTTEMLKRLGYTPKGH